MHVKLPDIFEMARTLFQMMYRKSPVHQVETHPADMRWCHKARIVIRRGLEKRIVLHATTARSRPMRREYVHTGDRIIDGDGDAIAGIVFRVRDQGRWLTMRKNGGTEDEDVELEHVDHNVYREGTGHRYRIEWEATALHVLEGHLHYVAVECARTPLRVGSGTTDTNTVMCTHCQKPHLWNMPREKHTWNTCKAHVRDQDGRMELFVYVVEDSRCVQLPPLEVWVVDDGTHAMKTVLRSRDANWEGCVHQGAFCEPCGVDDCFEKNAQNGDLICIRCGHSIQDNVHEGQEFRKFQGEADRNHHGGPWNPLLSSSFNMNMNGGKGTYHDETKIRAFSLMNNLAIPTRIVLRETAAAPPRAEQRPLEARYSTQRWIERVERAQDTYRTLERLAMEKLREESVPEIVEMLVRRVSARAALRDLQGAREALQRRQMSYVQLQRDVQKRAALASTGQAGTRSHALHAAYLERIRPELEALEEVERHAHRAVESPSALRRTQPLESGARRLKPPAYNPTTIAEAKRIFATYRDSVKRIAHFHLTVCACVIAAYWRIVERRQEAPGMAPLTSLQAVAPPQKKTTGECAEGVWRRRWDQAVAHHGLRSICDLDYSPISPRCSYCYALRQLSTQNAASAGGLCSSKRSSVDRKGLNNHLPPSHPLLAQQSLAASTAEMEADTAVSDSSHHLEEKIQSLRSQYAPTVCALPQLLLDPHGMWRRLVGMCFRDDHLRIVSTLMQLTPQALQEEQGAVRCAHATCSRYPTCGQVSPSGALVATHCAAHMSADMVARESLVELWSMGVLACEARGFPCAHCKEANSITRRCWVFSPPDMLLKNMLHHLRQMLQCHGGTPPEVSSPPVLDIATSLNAAVEKLENLRVDGKTLVLGDVAHTVPPCDPRTGSYHVASGQSMAHDSIHELLQQQSRERGATSRLPLKRSSRLRTREGHARSSYYAKIRAYHNVLYPSSDQELPLGWTQRVQREEHAGIVFPWGTSHVNRIVYLHSTGKYYNPPYDLKTCSWTLDSEEWIQYVHDMQGAARDMVAYLHVPTQTTQWQPPAHWPPLPCGWAQCVSRNTGEILFVYNDGEHTQSGFPVRIRPGQPAPLIPWKPQPDGKLHLTLHETPTPPLASPQVEVATTLSLPPHTGGLPPTPSPSLRATTEVQPLQCCARPSLTNGRGVRIPLCSYAQAWRLHVHVHNQLALQRLTAGARDLLRELYARLASSVRAWHVFPPIAQGYADEIQQALGAQLARMHELTRQRRSILLPSSLDAADAGEEAPPQTRAHALAQWTRQQLARFKHLGALPNTFTPRTRLVGEGHAELHTVQITPKKRQKHALQQYAIITPDSALTTRGGVCAIKPTVKPWAHQKEVLASIRTPDSAIFRSGVIVVPCGGGKTLIGILITAHMACRPKSLVLCSNMASVEQWVSEYLAFSTFTPSQVYGIGLARGINLINIRKATIVVTTYQRLANARKSDGGKRLIQLLNLEWDALILDEVHTVPALSTQRLIADLRARVRIGITATLLREDDGIAFLERIVGPVRHAVGWERLTREGYIATISCIQICCQMSATARAAYARAVGSTQDNHLRPRLVSALNHHKFDVCAALIRHHLRLGHSIILFFEELHAMQYYAKHLRDHKGHPLVFIQSEEPEEQKLRSLKLFREGVLRVLCFSRTGDSSINLPNAKVGIQVSSHNKSRRQEAQRLGRVSRKENPGQKPVEGQPAESYFYTLISEGTKEQEERAHREAYLRQEGYTPSLIHWSAMPPHLVVEPRNIDENAYYRHIETLRPREIADLSALERDGAPSDSKRSATKKRKFWTR